MACSYLLGIDVGTSRIKAVLFDHAGNSAFSSWQNATLDTDMISLWHDVAATIKDVLNKMEDKATIVGVAASGQGEGLWLLDQAGSPVGPAILWNDARASETVEKFSEYDDEIRSITGSSLFPGATTVLLSWMSEHNPDTLDQAQYIMFCKDWIRYKLTGVIATDKSDASSSLLDLKTGAPSKELFKLMGIENRLSLIPNILNSTDIAGEITDEAAKLTGLKAGITVGAGAMDIVATAVGAGAIDDGDACSILGTTGCNMVVSNDFDLKKNSRTGSEIHAAPGKILNVTASMAATPNIDWVYNLFHQGKEYEEIEAELKTIPAGSGGIIYHPYISSSGERAPFYAPNARAQFTGLNETSTPMMMTRAVYEGVALSVRDCLEGQEVKHLYFAGGGARSHFWAQILADCTGLCVYISDETELCARGAALMAGVAAGIHQNLEQPIKTTQISPNKKDAVTYDAVFKKYQKIRDQMIPTWNA